jgi:hypothetical protein
VPACLVLPPRDEQTRGKKADAEEIEETQGLVAHARTAHLASFLFLPLAVGGSELASPSSPAAECGSLATFSLPPFYSLP